NTTGRADAGFSTEAPTVERDQRLPVALGGRLVVDPSFGEREAVVDAGIELDLAGGAGAAEQPAQFLDHRQRRQFVMLGAGDVGFASDLAEVEVRALLGVVDEP